ncbi:MAG: RIP metalloprotease RseP [Oleibacter sp.]|nr:RIP metalloprotease RseP [Thalassolituus sp.]
MNIRLLSESGGQREVQIPVYSWLADQDTPDPMTALGVEPRRLQLDPVMGTIEPGGAAERAGMQLGDRILAVDGRAVNSWAEWVEEIKVAANKPLSVLVERNGQETTLNLTPAAKDRDGEQIGYVGTAPVIPEVPESWLRTSHAGFFQGIWIGLSKTSDYIVFTLESLWKMIAGDVSVKNLSGPITIAKVAGASASGGLESFISFLALLSVSLGVLNLLPVPMLDGGHIVFYLAEMIRGKPLPDKVQDVAVRFGLMLIMSLMLVAFYNDISRL